ncbi:hypothetical protein ADUPG1_003115 [Aduncisulcus paluster]|uniref:Uncharacterized protein n=1 Tax=Aduncisulcus paluster TaxID=2918883 RepID=A0ABQ5KUL3_9EUKA|nr:hypothetical protein ADUPG1_003115 [Aduncisulcus paluster]
MNVDKKVSDGTTLPPARGVSKVYCNRNSYNGSWIGTLGIDFTASTHMSGTKISECKEEDEIEEEEEEEKEEEEEEEEEDGEDIDKVISSRTISTEH